MPKPFAQDVPETCLYVNDLEAAERFYTDIVGLTFVSREEGRHVFFDPETTNEESANNTVPRHGAHGPGHVAFSIRPDELQTWRDHLKTHGVEVETEVQGDDRGRSLYFRDPSGNSLEVTPPVIWGIE